MFVTVCKTNGSHLQQTWLVSNKNSCSPSMCISCTGVDAQTGLRFSNTTLFPVGLCLVLSKECVYVTQLCIANIRCVMLHYFMLS